MHLEQPQLMGYKQSETKALNNPTMKRLLWKRNIDNTWRDQESV